MAANRRERAKSSSRAVESKAVLVLGAHRSGTSAVARVCNLLGVDLGNCLLQARADNVSGFWEHQGIHEVHEDLLSSIGSSWHDVRPVPEGWVQSETVGRYRTRIIEILRHDFSGSPLWGIKDPRICRLLPLWLSILKDLRCKPYFLIVTRNPLEVAGSLAARDNFPTSKSLLLWLRHVIEAERDTRRYPRAFINYEAFLHDWRRIMSHAARELRLIWPNEASAVSPEVDHFLCAHLRHQRVDDVILETDKETSRWVREAYRALRAAANGDASRLGQKLSAIAEELDAASRVFQPWLYQFETERDRLHERIERLTGELSARERQINAIYNSTSWRLSVPIRWVGAALRIIR